MWNSYILIWSEKCIIGTGTAMNQEANFAITDTKRYVLVVTLSAQDNAKSIPAIKSRF